MDILTVKGELRKEIGTSQTKSLRRSGQIPCVLYGKDVNYHFTVSTVDIKNLVYTSDFNLIDLEIDGKEFKSIIREIQFHPVTEEILHIDFLKLIDGRKVKVEVPVRFKGTSPGEKLGGKIIQNVRRVKLKTTPEHLVDEVVIDISEVELGQSVRIRDIEIGDDIEIMHNPGIPVATVEVPRALKSAEAEEDEEVEEETEGSTPEQESTEE